MKLWDVKRLSQLERTRLINAVKFSGGYSFTLVAVIFHLTYRCNLACSMCILYQRRDKGELPLERIDTYAFKTAIDEICSSFIIKPLIHFSGGEPLIYPDFSEVCSYCQKKMMRWSLTTNGFFLSEFAETIVSQGCRCVNVSVDGVEQIHNSIRGHPESFQRAIQGIMIIDKLKRQRRKKCPIVTVTCTINDKNYNQLEEIVNYFCSRPIQSLTFQHLSFGKDFIFGEDFNYDIAQSVDTEVLSKIIKKITSSYHNIPISFVPQIRASDITAYYKDLSYEFNYSCVNPWLMAEIKPTSKVMVCYKEVGDIKSTNFKKIWNSHQSREVRKWAKKGLAGERCLRCCHRQYY
jgi:MoaA/NifB/PqqE/SkfB family radical SAM enzyme